MNKVPAASQRKFNKTLDLEKLQDLADALVKDEIPDDPGAAQVQDLMLLGTSMGGARPKTWSRTTKDSGSQNSIGLTLLRADEAPEMRMRWSYVILVEELRRVVAQPKKDARELFRRVCFNALISNIDDHPRNHALIAKDKDWRLSPAYDLTPTPAIARERRDLAMQCGDMGRYANAKNILSQHARFLVEKGEATKIVGDMKEQVAASWHDTVRACGVSEVDAEAIREAFVYEGFSL